MSVLFVLGWLSMVGLKVMATVFAAGILGGIITAVVRIVCHELDMRPKNRYYTF